MLWLNISFVSYNKYIQYVYILYNIYIYIIYMIIYKNTHSNKQAQGSLKFLDIAIHCHMLDLAEVSHQFKALCLSSGGCCLLGVSWQKKGVGSPIRLASSNSHTHNPVDGSEIRLTA